ncbi:hypothetical protein [Brucella sp. 2716]|uniref:hypothetical protein n=1 Tax=Brucella sp. 2716 TaxID=2975052 RepID=UPI00217E4F1F|nr:hypothetical protein [Brucella sp. 2716]UWF60329.1 hypothetical protein NYO66_15170 [Brucella sp. 2716]
MANDVFYRVQRVLPQVSLAPVKKTNAATPPGESERAELQAFVVDSNWTPAGAGISVCWQVYSFAGGGDIVFYDVAGNQLTQAGSTVTTQTDEHSLATIYAACSGPTITGVDVTAELGAPTQPSYGVQLVFHDPSGESSSYDKPFIKGMGDALIIPSDIELAQDEAIESPVSSLNYEVRYEARADTNHIPSVDYQCAFILNDKVVSLQQQASANTEIFGYIPYCQMYSDGEMNNSLKYIAAEINGGQSAPLNFLATGTPYQMPPPSEHPYPNLLAPIFKGTPVNGILTAGSFNNGALAFYIDSFPQECIYGKFDLTLYLDGWDPRNTRVTRSVPLKAGYYLQQSDIDTGYPINIAQRVFRDIGAYKEENQITYGDLYLIYSINEVKYSAIYYSQVDFSGISVSSS